MKSFKQLSIALQCGFNPKHPVLAEALEKGATGEVEKDLTITPEDLLTATSTGKTFFAYKETWQNIDKLMELCPDLKGSHLLAKGEDGKVPADYVEKLKVQDQLFYPPLWKGEMKAFNEAWFEHSGTIIHERYLAAKRQIAEVEGTTIREDQLEAMGITYSDIAEAIRSGEFEEIRNKMAEHGDHLRVDDVFLLKGGDHMLDYQAKWEKIEALWDELAANKEQMTANHFLFKIGNKRSPLEVAVASKLASKIFNANLWSGRLPEMMTLYRAAKKILSTDHLNRIPIDQAIKDITEREFAETIVVDKGLDKKFLLTGLHKPIQDKNDELFTTTPMAMQKTWSHMGEIREILKEKGETLTLDELRQTTGVDHESAMFYAARFGNFEQVISIAKEAGEPISVADLMTPGSSGETIFEILDNQEALDLILDPTLWVGREKDLGELFDNIPKDRKQGLDFGNLLGQISVITLREHFGKGASNRQTPPPPANDGPPNRKFG